MPETDWRLGNLLFARGDWNRPRRRKVSL